MKKLKLLLAYTLLSISIITAQSTNCPATYTVALTQTEDACNATDTNQACYGNNTVNLVPFASGAQIKFDSPGDTTDVDAIRTLSLSALDDASGTWGIAMIRLLANLSPSQTNDITLLLFGDVEVESAVNHSITRPVTTSIYANLRQLPNTSAAIVGSVAQNTSLTAVGRTEDNMWVQVRDEATNVGGWLFGELLMDFDMDVLEIVSASLPYFGPMQAFYYTSGNHQSSCTDVPTDGLLIQTPEGVGRVTIWVNEVTIDFVSNAGSTAYVTAPADAPMTVNMVEGDAYVGTESGGYVAVEGSSVSVDQPANNAPPKVHPPQPSEGSATESTPVELFDRPVKQSEPAKTIDIATSNGLSTTQYEEVTTYGYVITTETDNPSVSPETASGANIEGSGQSSDTTTSDPADGNQDSVNTNPNSDNCPGNSCNAPGQNKGNNGNNGNGNNGNNGNGGGNNGNGNGNGNGGGNGNGNGNGGGNNGNGNGNGGGNNGNGNNGNNGNGNGKK